MINGTLFRVFDREAESRENAVASTPSNVKRVGGAVIFMTLALRSAIARAAVG